MADGSLSQFKATLTRKKERKEKAQGKFDRKKFGFRVQILKLNMIFPSFRTLN